METTATWMEERVFDAVDDNRRYLRLGQLGFPKRPVDIFEDFGGAQYGNWVFFEYLSHRFGNAYVSAALAYAWHQASTSRTITVGPETLIADFQANSLGARVETGYRFAMQAVGWTPYAALQAQSFRTPSYSETDGSGLVPPWSQTEYLGIETGGGFELIYANHDTVDFLQHPNVFPGCERVTAVL